MPMPMGNGTMHKMWMFFHTETNDTLLFSFWTIKTAGAMFLACFLLFLAAFSFELLKWLRLVMEQKGDNRQPMAASPLTGPSATNRRYADSLLSPAHLLQTALFSLQLLLSYLLMLAIMTFSLWVLLAVCSGAAFGFWVFGRRQPVLASTNGRPNPEIH